MDVIRLDFQLEEAFAILLLVSILSESSGGTDNKYIFITKKFRDNSFFYVQLIFL